MAVCLLLAVLCGCGEDAGGLTRVAPSPSPSSVLCDPGFGFPESKPGCPSSTVRTGWLAGGPDGSLTFTPFRTLANDEAGQAFAESHGLEFPFSNDYYDTRTGPAEPLVLDSTTVCTGAILVGYQEPLADHPVDCSDLVSVVGHRRVPAAVWSEDAATVQVSELYRP